MPSKRSLCKKRTSFNIKFTHKLLNVSPIWLTPNPISPFPAIERKTTVRQRTDKFHLSSVEQLFTGAMLRSKRCRQLVIHTGHNEVMQ